MNTFEEFLQEKFDEHDEFDGVSITKDNCDNMFDGWVENLDVQELIDFGQMYGKYIIYETLSDIGDKITIQTLKAHDELKLLSKTN